MTKTKEDDVTWETDPLWYKDAIIYELHIKAFKDGNNDGFGDIRGLIEKLDYLQDLGVNTLWLMPFYNSPLRDDGYDVSDYRNVHPNYGTRRDFRNFINEAHRRGLKVITEFVMNHTSDQHSWFQAARKAPPTSSKRDYYIWSDNDQKFPNTRIIFNDSESSNWAWDSVAQSYYWHRFFAHQPSLNYENPRVVKAMIKILQFWLDMGVDGFRLDNLPYLCVREDTSNENLSEAHTIVKQIRKLVDSQYKNRILLASANQWPEDVRGYFGRGNECHMAYHFPLMPRMYMAIGQEDRFPIVDILAQTPEIPESCQWAVFLRNHDELTLSMVTDQERDYMYQAYAADPKMRIHRGIRRRLAPLLGNNHDKIRLMNGLLLSIIGSPVIYYGDEIGMGDNTYLGDRNGMRTPMQWSPDRNAGFSNADPQRIYLPPIMDALYGYEATNVQAQSRHPSSLLSWMKRLIAVRKSVRAFGRGTLTFLNPGNRKILAYVREYQNEIILCVFNLSRSAQPVALDLGQFKGLVPVEMLGKVPFPPVSELPYVLTLAGYGFYWFNLTTEAEAPEWHEDLPIFEVFPALVFFKGIRSIVLNQVEERRKEEANRLKKQIEKEILADYLNKQRWFGAKGEKIKRIDLERQELWKGAEGEWALTWAKIHFVTITPQTYFIPFSLAWSKKGEENRIRALLNSTLTRIREHDKPGVLYEAFSDEGFCRSMVKGMQNNDVFPLKKGKLRFSSTAAFEELAGENLFDLPIKHSKAEGSNTAIFFGDRLFMKAYRRFQEGMNPELEMGRFLTDVSPFANMVPLAGALEYEDENGNVSTMALLQEFMPNQGDAWTYLLDYLKRFLEDNVGRSLDEILETNEEVHTVNLLMMRTLGLRTGEMHKALSKPSGDPLFDPESLLASDMNDLAKHIGDDSVKTLDKLSRQRDSLPKASHAMVDRLLEMKGTIEVMLSYKETVNPQSIKTRYHGDYHMGQVLVVKNDFIIIDFEGEPLRPLAERRIKLSPIKDVTGMLRSFNYVSYASLQAMTEDRPNDMKILEPLALDWEHKACQAFMDGYLEGIGDSPIFPKDEEQSKRLMNLFTLEKALYELRYEMDNRPTWIGVPLGGILSILESSEKLE